MIVEFIVEVIVDNGMINCKQLFLQGFFDIILMGWFECLEIFFVF